jgi:hypothetical protein
VLRRYLCQATAADECLDHLLPLGVLPTVPVPDTRSAALYGAVGRHQARGR